MSILIRNVQVIDGTGAEPYQADVFLDKNLISAIGNLKNKDADEVIDGLGNYLAPGFVDIDTSSDHYLSLLSNPLQGDFSSQGVTTIIGGHCGSSLAPLLYGTLESIRKWVDISKTNVNWHNIHEFLHTLSNFPLGVNFGTLVGHSTIRRSILGEAQRELTKDEMNVFKKILGKALEEGSFGLSTGLGYAHGKHTPPGEIKELVNLVKEYDGIYSTHLRNEREKLSDSLAETVKIAEESGVRTLISHFKPIIGYEEQYDAAYKKIESIRKEGRADLRFYVYPFDASLEAIYKLLPDWAAEKNLENMLSHLKNPDSAFQIKRDLDKIDLTRVQIADAPRHDYLVGKTPNDLSEMFGMSPLDSLIKAMEVTKLRATVFYKNINYPMLLELLKNENVLIASNGSARMNSYRFLKHERASKTFTKYLSLVRDEGLAALPIAIKRITSVPAAFLGLKERGVVKEGKAADLVLLDKTDYKVKDVILNGRVSYGIPLKHKRL